MDCARDRDYARQRSLAAHIHVKRWHRYPGFVHDEQPCGRYNSGRVNSSPRRCRSTLFTLNLLLKKQALDMFCVPTLQAATPALVFELKAHEECS